MLGLINQIMCEAITEQGQTCTTRGGDAPPCGRRGFHPSHSYPDAATHQLFHLTRTATGRDDDELARFLGERTALRLLMSPPFDSLVTSMGNTLQQFLVSMERALATLERAQPGFDTNWEMEITELDACSARVVVRHAGTLPGADPTAFMKGFLIGIGRAKGATVSVSTLDFTAGPKPRSILSVRW